jgi:hypothetical protein
VGADGNGYASGRRVGSIWPSTFIWWELELDRPWWIYGDDQRSPDQQCADSKNRDLHREIY